MSIELKSQLNAGDATLFCSGTLVAGEEGRVLRMTVSDLLQKRPRVVVDLREIHYIDGGGLGVLVGLYSAARIAEATLKYRNLVALVDYHRNPYHPSPTPSPYQQAS